MKRERTMKETEGIIIRLSPALVSWKVLVLNVPKSPKIIQSCVTKGNSINHNANQRLKY